MRLNVKKLILAAASAAALLIGVAAPQAEAQQIPGRTSGGSISAPAPANDLTAAQTQAVTKPEWVLTPDEETVRVPLHKVISVRLPGRVNNVVVGNPDIADVILPQDGPQNHVYVLARQVGATSIVFEDGRGNILFQGDIQVDVDVIGIQNAIKEMMPDDKIDVVAHRNSVFLKGFVRSAVASNSAVNIARKFVADPIEVINNLEIIGSQQVMLKVRIAEIKRTAVKGLGIELGLGNRASFTGTTSMDNFSAQNRIGVPAFGAAATTGLNGVPGLTSITIQALEEQGFAKTLAEPTLTAVSGETASFLAGGTFPMVTNIDQNGVSTYTQTPYGVLMNFTPVVMDKGNITLQVQATVSDIDNTVAINGFPGLTEKTTQTTIELPSGGTMYLSGLIQNDLNNYVEGLPGLKDIPVLGQLFRSEGFRNEETELVVIITAYLAQPTSNAKKLALPSDGFALASDIDFFLLGQLHKVYAKKPLPPYASPLSGPYGYIME